MTARHLLSWWLFFARHHCIKQAASLQFFWHRSASSAYSRMANVWGQLTLSCFEIFQKKKPVFSLLPYIRKVRGQLGSCHDNDIGPTDMIARCFPFKKVPREFKFNLWYIRYLDIARMRVIRAQDRRPAGRWLHRCTPRPIRATSRQPTCPAAVEDAGAPKVVAGRCSSRVPLVHDCDCNCNCNLHYIFVIF